MLLISRQAILTTGATSYSKVEYTNIAEPGESVKYHDYYHGGYIIRYYRIRV